MKKHISIIVALVLLITNLLSVVAFADFSDVSAENQNREAILTLTKFGVINGYDDGTFKPEGAITRAEFTKMMMTALGRANASIEPTEFSDVGGHWARFYIKAAYDMEIINGFPGGIFDPDAQVTYEQALKMVVCALGYVDFAEDKGGFPVGYTTQARDLGLTDDVKNQEYSAPALRQVIAQVVYNALDIEKRRKDRKGDWQPTGETILSEDLDMAKLSGILVGVEDTTTENCDSDLLLYQMAIENKSGEEVIIDIREYTDLTVSALQNYVGNEVTVYYRDNNSDEKSLVIFDADTTKNTTLTITSEELSSYNGTTLKYMPDGDRRDKSKSVNAEEVTVIYNGQTLTATDSYTIKSKVDASETDVFGKAAVLNEILNEGEYKIYGDITLTDSGSDGTVDMITINDYRWMIAHKTVSSANYTVQNTLVTTDTLVIDPEDPDSKVYVEKNGKEVAPTAISKGDVLTYTESFDGKVVKVYVSKQTVKGRVTSMKSDEITIDTKSYNLDPRCVEFVYNKAGKTLSIGNTVNAYLDKMGTVIYTEISEETAGNYAYITKAQYEEGEDTLYVTAFIPKVSKDSVKTYGVADRVKINGVVCESDAEAEILLLEALPFNNPDAPGKTEGYDGEQCDTDVTSQVARIKLENGKIKEIVTLKNGDVANNSDASSIAIGAELNNYDYTSGRFKLDDATKFSVNSSTTVIYVPSDRENKDGYISKTYTVFKANNAGGYWLEAYDVDENQYAGLILLYDQSGNADDIRINKITSDSPFSVVGGEATNNYDADEDRYDITVPLYTNSIKSKSWMVQPALADAYNALSIGDVIQYEYDDNNTLRSLETVMSYSDIKTILDGDEYDWETPETDAQTSDNRWQKYTYDFRYPKTGLGDEIESENFYQLYSSSAVGSIPYSRAAMFNVLRKIPAENKLHVTREGFVDGVLQPNDYEDVVISSSTPILRAVKNSSGNITKFTEFDEDDPTKKLDIDSFLDAQSYGTQCSKIMVLTLKGTVKMIVIYE